MKSREEISEELCLEEDALFLDDFENVDKNTVKFTLVLKPNEIKKFEYVLTTYHGVREEETTQ